jgi:hypothetical protein
VRSVAEIRNVAADPIAHTFTIYDATQWQQKLTTWLFEKLDRPRLASAPPTDEFSTGAQPDPAVCVLYPATTKSLQEILEFSTVLRSLIEIRRAFVYSPSGAVVVRGTPEEIASAKWLAAQLDTATGPDTATLAGAKESVMRVFRLNPALSIQQLQEHTTNMRMKTRIRRVFTYNAPRIVVARGTAEEITAAEKVFRDQGVL